MHSIQPCAVDGVAMLGSPALRKLRPQRCRALNGSLTLLGVTGGMDNRLSTSPCALNPLQDAIVRRTQIERLRALLKLQLQQIEAWDGRLHPVAPGQSSVHEPGMKPAPLTALRQQRGVLTRALNFITSHPRAFP